MHHEVELGVVIGKNGRDIPESEAESYIAGYSTSCTARTTLTQSSSDGHDGEKRPGCSQEEGITMVDR
jgi:2-keto-4-pentenoate hydratase/2-oxohepta-3-ene-1,7-dioic acid hydratase in catechol pathway